MGRVENDHVPICFKGFTVYSGHAGKNVQFCQECIAQMYKDMHSLQVAPCNMRNMERRMHDLGEGMGGGACG
jgi:hypothetical protein